jgi:hypothetical protein
MSLAEYPGFTSFAPEIQKLLLDAEDGDNTQRPVLLERVADVLNVFIGLDLLEYVFMPVREDEAETVEIDLIVPPEEPAIAWFTVDEAGYDEFRDAVTLFGDLADVLNPPIVLDVDEGEGDGL